jgi:ectoine hydroxylase-related dioxygenase (phytanoyl-CoA dioxygenase family)
MDIKTVQRNLELVGYCVVPNVLSEEEVRQAKEMFYSWQKTIPNHDKLHSKIDPHGIYKHHEVGHQQHAWFIRTRPKVQEVFKSLWKCQKLIVSFDGSCYISKENQQKDNIWTHTDQAPNSKNFECYQGFVALTENKERTLVVYEGSHLLHKKYFEDRGINSSKNWNLIDHQTLEELADKKKILHIPAGALVLWDSRTFHQNQYGKPKSEERIVQYVCFLPDNHPKNNNAMKTKRKRYFLTRRTTSHWPAPIRVNGLQPQNWGDESLKIDYNELKKPDLESMMDTIKSLL